MAAYLRLCPDFPLAYHLPGKQTMRTTLNLDERALEDAMAFAQGMTKTEVVNEALRHFGRARRQRNLLGLRGQVDWQGDLDQLRKRS